MVEYLNILKVIFQQKINKKYIFQIVFSNQKS